MPAIQPKFVSEVANREISHPYDIRYGRATVPYLDIERGWLMPGGRVITSRAVAEEKAKQINKIICGG